MERAIGDKAFPTTSHALWNKLSPFIRAEKNFGKFKTLVKSYLLVKAFGIVMNSIRSYFIEFIGLWNQNCVVSLDVNVLARF